MPDDLPEPAQLVLKTFDTLIGNIKSTRPLRSDGGTLTSGFVYAQLMGGMPVNPVDYNKPYSPMGGVPFADAVTDANKAAATAAARASMEAAFKTSRLVDTMIMVSNDDTYHAYPAARRISASYEGFLRGIQPTAETPIAPDVQKRVAEATKLLYEVDGDGNVIQPSRINLAYQSAALAYAQAKQDYATEQAKELADPMAGAGPAVMTVAQQKVDLAHANLVGIGGGKVEAAMDILASVGISFQAHLTATARKAFDQWKLALSGVADPTLYSYITPSNWADPNGTMDGWTTLEVTESQYKSHSEYHNAQSIMAHAESHFEKDEGSGGFSLFGFGAHAGGGSEKSSWSNSYRSSDGTKYQFHNDAKNLSIHIEYALCTINRPWFIGDLFYMRDYYVSGNKKKAISTGQLEDQVNNDQVMLPMIPVQFLAVRNVQIKASMSDWGRDGETLTQMYSDASSHSESWNAGGGGGFDIGFFSIGGSGSHTEGSSQYDFNALKTTDSQDNVGWSFKEGVLQIKGTQIVAWLSEILPAAAPKDDPTL